jgi:hypothetical protein
MDYMTVYFFPRGRLGNAIFRYFACSLFCIKYNQDYSISYSPIGFSIGDDIVIQWMNGLPIELVSSELFFAGYYQHDRIYKENKGTLITYMNNHLDHFVLTDGITAGDGHLEQFFIRDLLYEPAGFSKIYDIVIHIRLDDHVTHGLNIRIEYVLGLLERIPIVENSCIVVQTPTTDFEREYIRAIVDFVFTKYGVNIRVESNDTLTDYYIMKNAHVLVCSMSTLSWAAAFLSSRIEKCYFPDHSMPHGPHCSMKRPIENTELYSIGSE